MPRRTALIVPVPEAEPTVGALRLRHDSSAARGVPAHVTVLFPFLPPEEIDAAVLEVVFAGFPAFEFELDRVERFEDGVVWLHPEPSAPFVDLTAVVHEHWPDYPPYEGVFDKVIPHLTVSDSGPVDLEVDLQRPIAARATEVALYVEDEATGNWSQAARFALAQGVA
jgi:2'-5' RNA ligase superfamily